MADYTLTSARSARKELEALDAASAVLSGSPPPLAGDSPTYQNNVKGGRYEEAHSRVCPGDGFLRGIIDCRVRHSNFQFKGSSRYLYCNSN